MMAKDKKIKKKPYSNPEITRVNLKSEEAVLSGCKIYGNTQPYGAGEASCKYKNFVCSGEST